MKLYKFLFFLLIISCNKQSENIQKDIIKKESTKTGIYYAKCTDSVLSTGQKILKGDNWSLNTNEVDEVLKLSTEIDENEWHFSYPVTPCNIDIENYFYKGKKFSLRINGGSYVSLFDGKKTIILGCDSPECSKYFLLPKENMEESENDAENYSNSTNNIQIDSSKVNLKQVDRWKGVYNSNINYGKLDKFSEMAISYTIEIKDGSCTFSGIGYKTYFTDLCKIETNDDKLFLKYIKSIDGDGFSDHSDMEILGVIIAKGDKYYLKSPVVADKNWNYNVEVKLDKTK